MNKKILILTGVFPPDIGGPATQLDALIKELIKYGFRLRVLTFGKDDGIRRNYLVKRISWQHSYFTRAFLYFYYAFSFSRKADILYIQDLYLPGFIGWLMKKILRKKLVARFVGDSAWETACSRGLVKDDIISFQEKKYSFAIELKKSIRKRILKDSDKVVVVSGFLKELAEQIGVEPQKIKVIYNSVDFLDGEFDKKEIRKDKKNKILLTVARLAPWKGIDLLIRIMPDLIKKHQHVKLVVVGKGPEKDYLKNLASNLNLGKQVIFTGKLGRKQVLKQMKASDIFVLNTNYEGMSHTILESMKAGLPVITTKAGGNPETIRDCKTGILIDYMDEKQWIKAISFLLDHPEAGRKLARAAKDDLKRFNWNKLVKKTIEVFEGL